MFPSWMTTIIKQGFPKQKYQGIFISAIVGLGQETILTGVYS